MTDTNAHTIAKYDLAWATTPLGSRLLLVVTVDGLPVHPTFTEPDAAGGMSPQRERWYRLLEAAMATPPNDLIQAGVTKWERLASLNGKHAAHDRKVLCGSYSTEPLCWRYVYGNTIHKQQPICSGCPISDYTGELSPCALTPRHDYNQIATATWATLYAQRHASFLQSLLRMARSRAKVQAAMGRKTTP